MTKHGAHSIALEASRKAKVKAASGNNFVFYKVHVPDNVVGGGDVRGLRGVGFCNFLSDRTTADAFRWRGKPVDHSPEVQSSLRQALKKLAFGLESEEAKAWAPDHLKEDKAGWDNVAPGDNPNIPSGYTYLLQLVAHDIVQSTASLARIDDGRMALNNGRLSMLRLESIYNGGPEASPLLYEAAPGADPEIADELKSYLRLGPLNTANAFTCPFRDLARLDVARTIDDVKKRVMDPEPSDGTTPSPASHPLPDVMAGDRRNDDHPILSQLTVVFHLLHNGLVKWAEDNVNHKDHADNPSEAAFDRYYFARMASTLIFRHILRHDVLKRLLHGRIYDLYNRPIPPEIGTFDGRIPLEFTHGALRVCHAMLRDLYKFNERKDFSLKEVLRENADSLPLNMPLREFWAVAWSNFFDIDPKNRKNVNLSARLRPHYNDQTIVDPPFGEFDSTGKLGLAYRDMLSAALAGMWSAPALMRWLADQRFEPEVAEVFKTAELNNDAHREAALKDWFDRTCELDADESDALAKDPPLPFFLMFEAMADSGSRGLRLGPLGSIIVGSVVFGILNRDPIMAGEATMPLNCQICSLYENVFGKDAKRFPYPAPDDMAKLIRLVAELHELEGTKPRFI